MAKPIPTSRDAATQVKRSAWVALAQLPPHLYGMRRGTQKHQNRLRAQRMGHGKHRAAR